MADPGEGLASFGWQGPDRAAPGTADALEAHLGEGASDVALPGAVIGRQQALVEKSPARQQELLKEANALRDKAIETRNRLQGEADAAASKAKDAKKSE